MIRLYLILISTFFFCSAQDLNAQYFEWAKRTGGTDTDVAKSSAIDAAGNLYTVGTFRDTVDFDPGPGVFELYSGTFSTSTVFVSKFDSSGDFLWAVSFSGNSSQQGNAIAVDDAGSVYLAGGFANTLDFDPGPGSYLLTASGSFDAFVCKLNADGSLAWARNFGTANNTYGMGIDVDDNGNVFATGMFGNTVDFDPGPGVVELTSVGSSEIFIVKLDNMGNLAWAKGMGGTYNDWGHAIATDNAGNAYTTGYFSSTVDFDPGPGTFNMSSTMSEEIFVSKLDSNGNFVWAKRLGGYGGDWGNAIRVDDDFNVLVAGSGQSFLPASASYSSFITKLDPVGNLLWENSFGMDGFNSYAYGLDTDTAGNVYASGYFAGTIDFDPDTVATFNITSQGLRDVYTIRFSSQGDFVWVKTAGGSANDQANDVVLDAVGNVYVTGGFAGTADFNLGDIPSTLSSAGVSDAFYLKYSQDACSAFSVSFVITDITCFSSGAAAVQVTGGEPPYQYQWTNAATGAATSIDTTGLYSVTVTSADGCVNQKTVIVDGPDYFNDYDLMVHAAFGALRLGVNSYIWVNALNDGCIPVDGSLVVVLNDVVEYVQAAPPPSTVAGDTLKWEFVQLTNGSGPLNPTITVIPVASASFGDLSCYQFFIHPQAGDADTTNNDFKHCSTVVNAFDPNDKQVYPSGTCDAHYTDLDSGMLKYTVRFQNTGNAEAINVFVLDTLDSNLDLTSVDIVGTSHQPVITEVLTGNVLKFRFDNIMLPDSNSNEPSSHGYVIYEVNPLPNTPSGTVITNSASIYFDFNEPVLTNTVFNTVVDSVPVYESFLFETTCAAYTLNDYTYDSSGTYTQTISTADGCDSVITLELTINPLEPNVILTGNALSTGIDNASYQWIDCANHQGIPGETSQIFVPDTTGNYAVVVTLDNCTDTSYCFNLFVDGINAMAFSELVELYPNPLADGVLSIKHSSRFNHGVAYITDVLGQRVSVANLQIDITTFDAAMTPGVFFVRLEVNDGLVVFRRFVKQ